MATKTNVFQTFTGENGQHYSRFKAKNGEIVWQSEGYIDERDAEHAILLLIEAIGTLDYTIVPNEPAPDAPEPYQPEHHQVVSKGKIYRDPVSEQNASDFESLDDD
jgi:uncharacterized protein YegP (UPF0339 family)